jgi:hypothetical protein
MRYKPSHRPSGTCMITPFPVPVPPASRSFICEREIPTFAVFPYIGWHLRFFPGTGTAVPGVAIRHRIRELHIEYRADFPVGKIWGGLHFLQIRPNLSLCVDIRAIFNDRVGRHYERCWKRATSRVCRYLFLILGKSLRVSVCLVSF